MKEDLMTGDGGGWVVAGVLCDLDGAVLTASVGDGGLAGKLDLVEPLAMAANDAVYGRLEEDAR